MNDNSGDSEDGKTGEGGEEKKQRKVSLKTFARMLDAFGELHQLPGEDLLKLRDETLEKMRIAVEAECGVRAAKFAGVGKAS